MKKQNQFITHESILQKLKDNIDKVFNDHASKGYLVKVNEFKNSIDYKMGWEHFSLIWEGPKEIYLTTYHWVLDFKELDRYRKEPIPELNAKISNMPNHMVEFVTAKDAFGKTIISSVEKFPWEYFDKVEEILEIYFEEREKEFDKSKAKQ